MRHNIFIQKNNERKWRSIPPKFRSRWVNQLLASQSTKELQEMENIQVKIIRNKKEAEVAVESLLVMKVGDFCKNGHSMPEGQDKCMVKGCQYSR